MLARSENIAVVPPPRASPDAVCLQSELNVARSGTHMEPIRNAEFRNLNDNAVTQ